MSHINLDSNSDGAADTNFQKDCADLYGNRHSALKYNERLFSNAQRGLGEPLIYQLE